MPKSSKTPARTNTQPEDPKLYARIYASRLAKQVAEELGPSRRAPSPRKKTKPVGRG